MNLIMSQLLRTQQYSLFYELRHNPCQSLYLQIVPASENGEILEADISHSWISEKADGFAKNIQELLEMLKDRQQTEISLIERKINFFARMGKRIITLATINFEKSKKNSNSTIDQQLIKIKQKLLTSQDGLKPTQIKNIFKFMVRCFEILLDQKKQSQDLKLQKKEIDEINYKVKVLEKNAHLQQNQILQSKNKVSVNPIDFQQDICNYSIFNEIQAEIKKQICKIENNIKKRLDYLQQQIERNLPSKIDKKRKDLSTQKTELQIESPKKLQKKNNFSRSLSSNHADPKMFIRTMINQNQTPLSFQLIHSNMNPQLIQEYSINITRITGIFLSFGIIIKQIGKSLRIYYRNDKLFVDRLKEFENQGKGFRQGQTVILEINYNQNMFRWKVKKEIRYQHKISEQIANLQLIPFVQLFKKGDSVQFLSVGKL